MKKLGLLLQCLIVCNLFSWGQNTDYINYDEVKEEIAKADSPFYYENLYQRYLDQDTTFTQEEFIYLYYGNVFQDGVNDDELGRICYLSDSLIEAADDGVDSLLLISMKDLHTQLIEFKDVSLKKHLVLGRLTKRIYTENKATQAAIDSAYRYDLYLVNAISSSIMDSGDGRSERTAFCVTNLSDLSAFNEITESYVENVERDGHSFYVTERSDNEKHSNVYVFSMYFIDDAMPFSEVEIALDYDEIKKEVSRRRSPYYYPKLLKKYAKNYKKLTDEEYFYLYYGAVFQKSYNPYSSYKNEDYQRLMKKGDLTNRELKKLNKLGDEALKENPIQLDILSDKLIVNSLLYGRESDEAKEYVKKYYNFIRVLLQNSGLALRRPIYVINITDEYEVLKVLDLQFKGQALLADYDIDEIKVSKEGKEWYMYFDVTPSLEFMKKQMNQRFDED